jgi:hypothetical protein
MSELIDRYVHQVGRYLPRTERAEIEAELRSQIHDQLEDRFGPAPTPEDVMTVLAEMGAPRHMAASYNRDQYLIGPALYPLLMMVLRHGWFLVPAVVIFLHLFGLLIAGQPATLTNLVIEPLLAALQATLIFSAVVVLIFALIQRFGIELEQELDPFIPADLPAVDDPRTVNRLEATSGMAAGIVVTLVLLYFLSVGGLTLRFNLSDPGEVIPVPVGWLVALITSSSGIIVILLYILRRNQWTAGWWLVQMVLEMLGVAGLYRVLYRPVVERLVASNPALGDIPLAEILGVISGLIILLNEGSRLVRLWNVSNRDGVPKAVSASR